MKNSRISSEISVYNKNLNMQKIGASLFHPLMKKRNELSTQLSFKKPLSIYYIQYSQISSIIEKKHYLDNLIKYFFNQEEKISCSNYEGNKSQKKRLIRRILAKFAVSDILQSFKIRVLPSQIIIKKNKLGMPFIELKKINLNFDIFISIADKDEWNMAIAGLNMIGIDIEKKRHFSPILIKRIFSEDEIQNSLEILSHLNSSKNGTDEDLAYTCMFSIKESISKALGYGLKIDFRKITIIPNGSVIKIELRNFKNQNINFVVFMHSESDYIYSFVENIA